MGGLGKKKLQRKAKKAAKKGNNEPSTSSSSGNCQVLPPDEWFSKFTEDVLDCGPMGDVMDGIMRNMIRSTEEIRTRDFGALKSLLGKNLVWLQLVLVDEKRVVQGKLHGIGAEVSPKNPNVAALSRRLFKEAVPYLQQDTDCWLFSRSLVFKAYNGLIDEALQFHAHDPIGNLEEPPSDMSLGTRCTEVFLFLAGDFSVEDGGLNSCEAVQKFLHELNTAEGFPKIHGFDVVAGSTKVIPEKLAQLKLFRAMHLSA